LTSLIRELTLYIRLEGCPISMFKSPKIRTVFHRWIGGRHTDEECWFAGCGRHPGDL